MHSYRATVELFNMSAYCKLSRELKYFDCYEPLTSYKYTTSQRTLQIQHICEINKAKYEVRFQQCVWCSVASFSSIWRHFHEKICTFAGYVSNASYDRKAIKSEYDQCKFTTLK